MLTACGSGANGYHPGTLCAPAHENPSLLHCLQLFVQTLDSSPGRQQCLGSAEPSHSSPGPHEAVPHDTGCTSSVDKLSQGNSTLLIQNRTLVRGQRAEQDWTPGETVAEIRTVRGTAEATKTKPVKEHPVKNAVLIMNQD